MAIPLLQDIVVIFGLSVIVLFIFHRIKIPSIAGFFLTGIIAGPNGLGLVSAVGEVQFLAEIGIIFLLFIIGIEFSFEKFSQLKRSVLMGGTLQVVLTFLIVFVIAQNLGVPVNESIFIGFLVSLSSTAIVFKFLQDKNEIDSPQGRISFGILIFQDIIVIPMILFTPLLVGTAGNLGASLFIFSLEGIGIILFTIVSAKWIVPRILYQIARLQSRELFLLSIITIIFAITWLTSTTGLSPALGAFLAGLIISNSEYSHQALGNILPFRDIFASFFFISIGMLLNVNFLIQYSLIIILIVLSILIIKSLIAGIVTAVMGFSLRIMVLVGLMLSQIGEFSFVLSLTGVQYGLLTEDSYQLFLSVAILTMTITPFIMAVAPRAADVLLNLPFPDRIKVGTYPIKTQEEDIGKKDHLIIIGFGVNGENVTRAARAAKIPYVVVEINPEIVRSEMADGESIYYGDATHEAVLQHVDIQDARVVVIAISDPVATRRITEITRRLNPGVYIIVRTLYIHEMEFLYKLGADDVIPEEFETSVEIFSHVLAKYLIPKEEINEFISELREDSYEMFRTIYKDTASLCDLKLCPSDVEISLFQVDENSAIDGKSQAQIGLEIKYNVTLLVIFRDSKVITHPDEDLKLQTDDVVILLGPPHNISEAAALFKSSKKK
ncbi:MAG: cation:proton antiporter [Euryarchaeota archaeon]|nr:cation:proton antiporter [Euryarchaeota archaeon]MBU4607772.1 cation:proton antiporter [Euryarchaeota archaeon]MBV1730448.1 cation:proton antiporter [Methanobacterium sp.]MBV1755742.1 cation:proton antiporter [Methanobacterium sp.]